MRIIDCTLTEFGAFRNKTFTFGDGLNIIEGGNESGKSTLLAFIKFMFYGVPRKLASETVAERDRILSWSGGLACGRMTVETADGIFRIERSLRHVQSGARDTYPETVRLIDTATGEQIHKGEEPGEVFFGVPTQVFESTCAVRQTQCTHIDTAQLGSSIENLLFTGDESLNTRRAADRLNSVRRTLLHKNAKGGRLWELTEQRGEVRERLDRARQAAAAMVDRQLRVEDLRGRSAEQRERLAVCEETCANFENLSLLRRFAQLHELEKKTATLRERLDTLRSTRGHEGFLPDDAYLAYLRGLKQRLSLTIEDRAAGQAALKQAAREAEADERRKERLAHAEALRAAGGRELAMGQFAARRAAIRHLLLPGVLMAVLGVLLIAAGIAGTLSLAGLAIDATWQRILLIGGAVFGAVGALCLVLRGRKQKSLAAMLAGYGMTPACTEAALGAYLDECITILHRHTLAQDALQDATRLVAERERVMQVVCSDCILTLARMGIDAQDAAPEELYTRLDGALTEFSALAVEHENLRRTHERTQSTLDDLRGELAGQNEAELRAHLTLQQAQNAMGEDITKLRSERDYLRRAVSDADARCTEMEKQLVSLQATAEDPRKLSLQLEELDRTLADCRQQHDALVLAGEALAMASARVRRGVTPRLRSGAGELMGKLTGGRYTDLGISGSMTITVDADGETRPIEAMSGGTVDAAYLSLRLALLEVLYGVDVPPLLLDESLCQLDDERTRHFLSMLTGWCRDGAQCLLFTCQAREAVYTRDLGHFEHIRL